MKYFFKIKTHFKRREVEVQRYDFSLPFCRSLFKNKHFALSVLCSLFSVLLITSCSDKNYISNQSESIMDGAWKYEDTKDYTFDIADTSKVYNVYLALNHAEDYAYQNLYLKIHTLFPSGKKLEQQVSFELADKYGKWYGDCGSNCELLVGLQKGAYFNETGKHTITLEQFMRKDPILSLIHI